MRGVALPACAGYLAKRADDRVDDRTIGASNRRFVANSPPRAVRISIGAMRLGEEP